MTDRVILLLLEWASSLSSYWLIKAEPLTVAQISYRQCETFSDMYSLYLYCKNGVAAKLNSWNLSLLEQKLSLCLWQLKSFGIKLQKLGNIRGKVFSFVAIFNAMQMGKICERKSRSVYKGQFHEIDIFCRLITFNKCILCVKHETYLIIPFSVIGDFLLCLHISSWLQERFSPICTFFVTGGYLKFFGGHWQLSKSILG
jgi:hypothetical protein